MAQNKPNKQTERQDFVHSVLLGSVASHYWGFLKVGYCKFALWHRRDGVHVLLGHALSNGALLVIAINFVHLVLLS